MNKPYIDNEARKLLKEMWINKEVLWPDRQVTAFDVIDPKVACQVLGFKYVESPSLNQQPFLYKGKHYNVAGIIDRQSSRIIISSEEKPNTIRFTAGHEIGHCVLHPDEVIHHRDRPVSDAARAEYSRSLVDREADYFSSCFLIPEKMLKAVFDESFFVDGQFVFDDTAAFNLQPSDPNSLLRAEEDSLERELALARCTFFGRPINSLASIFNVSNFAMALRIKDLNLVRWP